MDDLTEVEAVIRGVLADQGRLAAVAGQLHDDEDLYRVGLTSHATVNVMLALEDIFDVMFPERMLRKGTFESIGAIRDAIGELAGRTEACRVTEVGDPPALRDLPEGRAGLGSGLPEAVAAAAAAADDVDRAARFPSEAIEALRAARLLSLFVPVELGGRGASVRELSATVTALGRACGSTAMVYAMHQIQVACLVRHGKNELLQGYLRELAEGELLLASATTEAGIGGDVRSSGCAVERSGGRVSLCKQASVISYGAEADAVLATTRRDPDSPPSDQVLVLCRPPALALRETGGWDTLGFRGTRSLGFELRAEDEAGVVLPDSFADISAHTMLPVSHVLWSSVWLGIADAAVERAKVFVQTEARRRAGTTPPQALRLAELVALHHQMRALVESATRYYDGIRDDPDALEGLGLPVSMNTLKAGSSRLVVEIVGAALGICGIAGYREDSLFSMGRLLRDAHGAPIMVGNDRILANTAQLLLVHRTE